MVKIELTATTLHVHVQGLDKLWAFKGHLDIPLDHVIGIEPAAEEASTWYHGIRAPGTSLPGVITAGTFYEHGNRVFWDVHHPANAVAIVLRDEKYQRLIVEVEDVASAITAVRNAIGPR